MASKMYASIDQYFAHWRAVPDLDLDKEYSRFLDKISETDDRRTFSLAAMEFFASLKNGHSDFYDQWLSQSDPGSVGFRATRFNRDSWVVTASEIDDLTIGDRIATIDGKPLEEFFRTNERYLSGSNESARVRALFYRRFLFPPRYELSLAGGKTITVDRSKLNEKGLGPVVTDGKVLEGGIAYLRIPSFAEPRFENDAIEFLKQLPRVRGLIIDVRGNGGGDSPGKLVAALMDRPFRDWIESTTVKTGVFGAYAKLRDRIPSESRTDGVKMLLEMSSAIEETQVFFGNRLTMPDKPLYSGPLIVIADGDCASACEDFIMPLISGGRADLYGTPTRGSTGQPYMHDFGNGMGFRVSAKRVYLPDMTEFEGVGLRPTVQIEPTVEDIRTGRDPVRERAILALR